MSWKHLAFAALVMLFTAAMVALTKNGEWGTVLLLLLLLMFMGDDD